MEGGCYCGAVRYKVEGDPLFRGECHCRECQYISGGGPNFTEAFAEPGFEYTKGEPAKFAREDLDTPVTREFCGKCGTPLLSRSPNMPGAVLLKVGSLDEPASFGIPQAAIYMCDAQPFHSVAEGVPTFDKLPG